MISVQEVINEVDNFRAKNQRLVEIFESEVEKEIVSVAKNGYRNKKIDVYCIWPKIEKLFGAKKIYHLSEGIKEITIRDLRKNGFSVSTYLDIIEISW